MMNHSPSCRHTRLVFTIAILIALVVVVLVQQSRISALKAGNANAGGPSVPPGDRTRVASEDSRETNRPGHRADDPLARARQEHLESVEEQLQEISAPLAGDMASTMFHADVKEGQSVVTGGYRTADGRNQFTILKPSLIRGPNGATQIQIDSKLIAVSQDDTARTGLTTLATNAKNTLQHAESWEEADVSSTMEKIRDSTTSEYLGEPKVVVEPGQKFTIGMTSDEHDSYTLAGTAELSPTGSGVVLKARIQQTESRK